MESNFECRSCDSRFFIPKYSVSISNSQPIYSTKFGVVDCPHCKSKDVVFIPNGELCTNVGEYSSSSAEDKKAMLKKRAKRAMRNDVEQRHEIETNFMGRVNEKHY